MGDMRKRGKMEMDWIKLGWVGGGLGSGPNQKYYSSYTKTEINKNIIFWVLYKNLPSILKFLPNHPLVQTSKKSIKSPI